MGRQTFLRYILRTLDDIHANVFGRQILPQRQLPATGALRRNNTHQFLLIDHLRLQRRRYVPFIAYQRKIKSAMTEIVEDIPSPRGEREADLPGDRQNIAAQNGCDD